LDGSFGTGGVVTLDFGDPDAGSGVAIQQDGAIVATGRAAVYDEALEYYFATARFSSTGTLDPTFGDGGIGLPSFGGVLDTAFGIALLPDGRIVAAGETDVAGNEMYALVRYLPSGMVDRSFGTGGLVTTGFGVGTSDRLFAVAMQSDGKPVVAGTSG